jgi:hypothetical protein
VLHAKKSPFACGLPTSLLCLFPNSSRALCPTVQTVAVVRTFLSVIVCFTLLALSLQIASERERIDLEWQAERKEAKAAHLKALAEYEEDREREEVSCGGGTVG